MCPWTAADASYSDQVTVFFDIPLFGIVILHLDTVLENYTILWCKMRSLVKYSENVTPSSKWH